MRKVWGRTYTMRARNHIDLMPKSTLRDWVVRTGFVMTCVLGYQ